MWPALWMMPTPDSNGNYHDGRTARSTSWNRSAMRLTRPKPICTHGSTQGKSFNNWHRSVRGFSHTYGIDWQADQPDLVLRRQSRSTRLRANVPKRVGIPDPETWRSATPTVGRGRARQQTRSSRSRSRLTTLRVFQSPGQSATGAGTLLGNAQGIPPAAAAAWRCRATAT